MAPKQLRGLPGKLSCALAVVLAPAAAHASMFKGETLDAVANGIAWVVLVLVPIIGISVFWLVHILPEKIAHKKQHPQTKAIQVLCLLSLVFGGMLWPIAWLWAYSKPVLYKMAYSTDVADEHDGSATEAAAPAAAPAAARREIEQLRAQLAALESRIGTPGAVSG